MRRDELYLGSIDESLLCRWMVRTRLSAVIPEPDMMTISEISCSALARPRIRSELTSCSRCRSGMSRQLSCRFGSLGTRFAARRESIWPRLFAPNETSWRMHDWAEPYRTAGLYSRRDGKLQSTLAEQRKETQPDFSHISRAYRLDAVLRDTVRCCDIPRSVVQRSAA